MLATLPLALMLSFVSSDMEHALTRHTQDRYTGDLTEIKKRGVLRVLTRNNSSAYFIANGRELGFQFELARELANELGVRLVMVVPSSRDDLLRSLIDGEGDLIAAGMTVTTTRASQVQFISPFKTAPRVLVAHADNPKPLATPADAARFKIHVDFKSTTRATANDLAQRIGTPLQLEDCGGDLEMEEVLAKVGSPGTELEFAL